MVGAVNGRLCFNSSAYAWNSAAEGSSGRYVNSAISDLSNSSSCSVIVRVSVVLKRTVGDSD